MKFVTYSLILGAGALLASCAAFRQKATTVPPTGAKSISITEFIVPTSGSQPRGITVGPDENLWFVEQGADKIAKMTTAGSFTEYPVPTAGSKPVGIVAGPNGNLWFTEAKGNKIGKLTTAGKFTEYPIPTPNGEPVGIVAGPDGNLWFTEAKG